jgi:hypothetical protein
MNAMHYKKRLVEEGENSKKLLYNLAHLTPLFLHHTQQHRRALHE